MLHNLLAFRRAAALAITAACLLFSASFRTSLAQPQSSPKLVPPPLNAKRTEKVSSEGVFTDKANAQHAWRINAAHALVWDKVPYLPAGGAFTPRSLASPEEADWQADTRALDALQAKGIHDLLLWPDKSLIDCPIKSVQRLLDYLETRQFHYGLAFGPGLTQPITGYVVKPSVYRMDARPNLTAESLLSTEWVTDNTDRGVVVMYDGASDSKIFRDPQEVVVRDGILSIPVEAPPSVAHPFVLLLPHKTLPPQDEGSLPDVWRGFDGYRDHVLAFARQLKWGPGLRFFLDPLARHIGLSGETPFLVPDSTAFRLEWESFLRRRYANPEEARGKWALMDQFKSISDISRLVPLWAYGRGCPYFYDPQTRRFHRMLEGSQSAINSQWWNDFQAYRDYSINYYMNMLADVLKQHVANVPVVYTWNAGGSFFGNNARQGGFDGLAVTTRGGEASRVARAFGPAYGQAEQSAHTTWFLASEIAAVPSTPSAQVKTVALNAPEQTPPAESAAYANRLGMFRDFDEMRNIGCKGFFIKNLQGRQDSSVGAASSEGDWLSNSEALSWLAEYGGNLKSNGAANQRPRVLFYPYQASGPAHTGLIPGTAGVYWLPGAFNGDSLETQPSALDLWPAYEGYNIQRHEGEPLSTVMISLTGQRKTHFLVNNPSQVRAYTPEGLSVLLKIIAKNTVEVTLDTTPTILQFESNLPPVPQEAAEDALLQLATLYEISKLQKVFGAENSVAALGQAKDYYARKNYGQAYLIARNALEILTSDAQPYIWIEGEQDQINLFNELAGHPEASQGAYRRLSTPNKPIPGLGYRALYKFPVTRDGVYQIWLAGTIPGPSTSPIKWRVNNEADRDIQDLKPRGPLYLNDRFGWILLGTAKLSKGDNKLVIDATDPAPTSHEYAFAIDALMITDKGFAPNAAIRPLPVDPATIREFKKEKKGSKDKEPVFP